MKGVFADPDLEYYRTADGELVSVPASHLFTEQGLREHLAASLSASMIICRKQGDALGIVEDGPELVEPLLRLGASTPADSPHYPCLLARWLGEGWLSTHLVALFLDAARRVLSPLPEDGVEAYFPFDRVARASEEFEAHEAVVREIIGLMWLEAESEGAEFAVSS